MDFAISAKCAPFPPSRSNKPFGNDLNVTDEVRFPDVVERIETVLGWLDDAEGIENHDLAAERLPKAARYGEVFTLDVEDRDRPVMVDDGGNDDRHAFPGARACDGDVMAGTPSGLRVGAVAQHCAAGETERQAAVVVPELAQLLAIHPSGAPWALF